MGSDGIHGGKAKAKAKEICLQIFLKVAIIRLRVCANFKNRENCNDLDIEGMTNKSGAVQQDKEHCMVGPND